MTLSSRRRRRGSGALIVAGAGSLTFDHHLGRPETMSAQDALAGDWKAVGEDLRRALRHRDFEAA